MDDAAVRILIADHLGVAPAEVVDPAGFDALGADALDVASLVLKLERALSVRVADAQAEACRTVGDLLQALRDARPRLAAQAAPPPVFTWSRA